MKLLVSVINNTEAKEAVMGGAHIIDVKNPKEGSLGANFPRIIKQIKQSTPENVEVSATIGDLLNLPGTASLAALGAAVSGAEYVKAGLFGVKTPTEATVLMKEICKAVRDHDSTIKVVAAGYADSKEVGCLNPLTLPEVAYRSDADGIMVDIKIKNGGKLFDFLQDDQLKKLVQKAHQYSLSAAFAGSLDKEDIPKVFSLGADIIGVRKAVCSSQDRLNGRVRCKAVAEFIKKINAYRMEDFR